MNRRASIHLHLSARVPLWTLLGSNLAGCGGHDCTAMGCEQGVTLEFAAPLETSGEYTFEVETGSGVVTCNAFVPLRRDGSEPSCEGMLIEREEITTETDDAVTGRAGDRRRAWRAAAGDCTEAEGCSSGVRGV